MVVTEELVAYIFLVGGIWLEIDICYNTKTQSCIVKKVCHMVVREKVGAKFSRLHGGSK